MRQAALAEIHAGLGQVYFDTGHPVEAAAQASRRRTYCLGNPEKLYQAAHDLARQLMFLRRTANA